MPNVTRICWGFNCLYWGQTSKYINNENFDIVNYQYMLIHLVAVITMKCRYKEYITIRQLPTNQIDWPADLCN